MPRVQVTLQLMNGEGLSPGEIHEYTLPDDENPVGTKVVLVSPGIIVLRPRDLASEDPDAYGVLAKIVKQSLPFGVTLEPLVNGTFIEPAFDSASARVFDSDRISVPPSNGEERHFIHLRPHDTVHFQYQGLKIFIMAEIANSTSPPSSDTNGNQQYYSITDRDENDVQPEVQVKSSNADDDLDYPGDEEDATDSDSSEDEANPPSTERTAKTPANADITPATSRPTENAILETPQGDADVDEYVKPSLNNDENPPYSIAPVNQTSDTVLMDDDDADRAIGTDSPTVQRQLERVARGSPKAAIEADPSSTVENTPESETDDEEEVFTPQKVKATYSKKKGSRATPRSPRPKAAATRLVETMSDEQDQTNVDDGANEEVERSPIITGTSDPLEAEDISFEAAARSVSSSKRNISKMEDEDRAPVVSKKRRTRAAMAVTEDVQIDQEAAPPAEDTVPGSKVKGKLTKPSMLQRSESSEEITVVQRATTAPKTSGKKRSSPNVVIPPQRASARISRASETPSSSTASSELTGKVPSILLSRDSWIHKSASAKWLKQQGAAIIDDVKTKRANFVCVVKGNHIKTAKVLRSLALNKLVITEDWITDSRKAGHLLDPEDFVHKELKDTIAIDRGHIFAGKNLFFTTTLVNKVYKDVWKDIEALAKEAGASHVSKGDSAAFGKVTGSIDVVCFGHDKGDQDAKRLVNQGHEVYHKDMLTNSILTGELDLDDDEYKLPG